MLKKTIEFVDFNGDKQTEDHYFNLTKSELTEMQLTTDGGMDQLLRSIINTKDIPELTKLFKKIILASYGRKSLDGKRFEKKDENGRALADEFVQSAAYDSLFMELLDADKAADFINKLIPQDIAQEAAKIAASNAEKAEANA